MHPYFQEIRPPVSSEAERLEKAKGFGRSDFCMTDAGLKIRETQVQVHPQP